MSQKKVSISVFFQIIIFFNFLRGRLVLVHQVQQLRVEVVRQDRGIDLWGSYPPPTSLTSI